MNPPYSRNMHLKFLEKTIEIADNVISIQPIAWLQNPFSKNNNKSQHVKYENSISKHIKELEIINAENAKKYFDAALFDCGIYVCDKDGGYNYKALSQNEVLDKVIEYIQYNKCNFEFNKKYGYRLRVPFICGGKAIGSGDRPPYLTELPIKDIVFKDGKYDGKWWYEYYMKNQYSKTTEEITSSIRFDSEEEGHNFFYSTKTNFVRYIENQLITSRSINENNILWMGNATNPRTNCVGYKSTWTNEDFYSFFNISQEQQQNIEAFIHNADKQINNWLVDHKRNETNIINVSHC